jgi:hypothetical protein
MALYEALAAGDLAGLTWPRISPRLFSAVWTLKYQLPGGLRLGQRGRALERALCGIGGDHDPGILSVGAGLFEMRRGGGAAQSGIGAFPGQLLGRCIALLRALLI